MANNLIGGGQIVQIQVTTAGNAPYVFALTDNGQVFYHNAVGMRDGEWREIPLPAEQQSAD